MLRTALPLGETYHISCAQSNDILYGAVFGLCTLRSCNESLMQIAHIRGFNRATRGDAIRRDLIGLLRNHSAFGKKMHVIFRLYGKNLVGFRFLAVGVLLSHIYM